MKRSVQEIVELLVFGLIALLIGTGLLWLAGWVFDLVGVLFKFFAALIWSLLRFIVPVAVGAAIVYALVRLIQQQRERSAANRTAAANEPTPTESSSASTTDVPPPPAPPAHEGGVEGESHPTASEIWVAPQPAPPTSSSESLDEPHPPEDSGPVGEGSSFTAPQDPAPDEYDTAGWAEGADHESAASAPADHDEIAGSVPLAHDDPAGTEGRDEATGSELPTDDETFGSVPLADDEPEHDHLGQDRPAGDGYDEDERQS